MPFFVSFSPIFFSPFVVVIVSLVSLFVLFVCLFSKDFLISSQTTSTEALRRPGRPGGRNGNEPETTETWDVLRGDVLKFKNKWNECHQQIEWSPFLFFFGGFSAGFDQLVILILPAANLFMAHDGPRHNL